MAEPPSKNDPLQEAVTIRFYDLLDAADELLMSHPDECACDWCHNLDFQFYTIQLFLSVLEGELLYSKAIEARKRLYHARVQERQRTAEARRVAEANAEEEQLQQLSEAVTIVLSPVETVHNGGKKPYWQGG